MNNYINVSFSGGRSSALMLKILLDNYDKERLIITFANTGREREETLLFVKQCEEYFGIDIHWLEADFNLNFEEGKRRKNVFRWKKVDFKTASRSGEPFAKLIASRKYLPNSFQRICTQWLKVELINKYLKDEFGLEKGEYEVALGIRKDEPNRYFKLKKEDENRIFPLWDFGATSLSVRQFWKTMPFDLQLKSYEGNCDMCFLKGIAIRLWIAKENPDLLDWWETQETKIAKVAKEGQSGTKYAQFDKNYSIAEIRKLSKTRKTRRILDELEEHLRNPSLFGSSSIGCFCGD